MPGGDAEHVSSSLNNNLHRDHHYLHHSLYGLPTDGTTTATHGTFDDSRILPPPPAPPHLADPSSISPSSFLSESVPPQSSSMSVNVPSNHINSNSINNDSNDISTDNNHNNNSEGSGRMSPDPRQYYYLLHQHSLADGDQLQHQGNQENVPKFPSLPPESLQERPHERSRRRPYRSNSTASSCSSSTSSSPYRVFAPDPSAGERPIVVSKRPRQSTFQDLVKRFNNNSDQVLPVPSTSGSRAPSATNSRSPSLEGHTRSRASSRLPTDTHEHSRPQTPQSIRCNYHPDSSSLRNSSNDNKLSFKPPPPPTTTHTTTTITPSKKSETRSNTNQSLADYYNTSTLSGGPRSQVPEHGDLSQLHRRGSDGILASPNPTFLEHYYLVGQSTSNAGLSTHWTPTTTATTTAWQQQHNHHHHHHHHHHHRPLRPSPFFPEPLNISADTAYHRRTRSDDSAQNSTARSNHPMAMAVPAPLNPTVVHDSPTWKSRIPVSSRRLSQDSASDNNDPSSSPVTAKPTFRSRDSQVVLPPKGTSRLPVPSSPTSTTSVPPKNISAPTPTTKSPTTNREVAAYNRGRRQSREDGPPLKAYIAAPPSKKSPPLRSSRPRQPVSSATAMSAKRRSKVLEKASSFQKQAEPRTTRPKDRRAPELAKVDFAMRRHKIQQAFNRTVQENAKKEEQEEALRRRQTKAMTIPNSKPSDTQKTLPESTPSVVNDTTVEADEREGEEEKQKQADEDNGDTTGMVNESSTEFHYDEEEEKQQPAPADTEFHDDPEEEKETIPQDVGKKREADVEFEPTTMDSPNLGRPDDAEAATAEAADREQGPLNCPELQHSTVPINSSSPPFSDTSESNDTYVTSFDQEPQTESFGERQDSQSHKSLLNQIMQMRDESSPSSSSSCHEHDYRFSDNDEKESIPILFGESPYVVDDTVDGSDTRQHRDLLYAQQQQDRASAGIPRRWSLSSWSSSVRDPFAMDVPHEVGQGFSRDDAYPEEGEEAEETLEEEEETSLSSVASTNAPPSVMEDQQRVSTSSLPRNNNHHLDGYGGQDTLQRNLHTVLEPPDHAGQAKWDAKNTTQSYYGGITHDKDRNLSMPAVRTSPQPGSLDFVDRQEDARANSLTDEPVLVSSFEEGISSASDRVGHSASLVFRDDWEHTSPSIADWMQAAAHDGFAPPPEDYNNKDYDAISKGEGGTPKPLAISPAELAGSEVPAAAPGQYEEDIQTTPQELDFTQAHAPPIPMHSPPPPPPPPATLFHITRRPVPAVQSENNNGLAQPAPPLFHAAGTQPNEPQSLPDGVVATGPDAIHSTGSSEDSSLRRLRPATSSLGRSSSTSLFPPSLEQASIEAKRSSPSPEQRRLKKRRHVIKELVDTEYTFGRDMKVVDDIYKGTSSSCLDLSADDVKVLFANSDQIVQFSMGFQDALKAAAKSVYVMPRSQRWGSKRSAGGVPSTANASFFKDERSTDAVGISSDLEEDQMTFIGQAFLAYLSPMEKVYADYLKNHDAANKKLQVLQRNPKVAIWLKECREWASDLTSAWDLDSLLVKPVQRILKYPLLLKQLIDSTPDDHPDREAIVRALDGVTDVSMRINEMKKRAELVEQVIGRKRKESDVRAGLSKAFGRRTEKLRQQVGLSDMFEDRHYDRLSQKFGDGFFQLQVVMRDMEMYTREVQDAMSRFSEFVSAIEAYINLAQSQYPGMEGRWRKFKLAVRDIVAMALPDHLTAIRKSVIDPMVTLLKLHEGPQKVMHKRDKRLMDYARFKAVKDRGDKPEKKTIEQGEQFVALNDALKDELPKLYSLTTRFMHACLNNFIQNQVSWFDLLQTKLRPLTDSFPDDIQMIVNEWSSGFAFTEGRMLTLGICNGTVLAEIVSSSGTTNNNSTAATAAAAAAVAKAYSHSTGPSSSAPRRPSTVNSNSASASNATRIGSSSSMDESSKFSQDLSSSMIYSPGFIDGYSRRRSNSRSQADSSISGRGRRGFGGSGSESTAAAAAAEMQRSQALQQVLNESPLKNRRNYAEPFPRLPSLNLDAPFMDDILGIGSSDSNNNVNDDTDNNNPPASPGGGRYSGFFSSAMPMSDSPHDHTHDHVHDHDNEHASAVAAPATAAESELRKEPDVLFLAASIYEFNIDCARCEAGYPYLTYVAGEIFDVIAEKGELWLAKNQDDPTCQVGWIWNKHFAKLAA